jgi:2-polyprenyl-6-methoxyphenol hydroxylase-like FAD-dependent oxidoreductase
MKNLHVQCCIAGGGPAGMMLGYLLARAGVKVAVLEKHADFLRDFRGDTIHPSTLEVLHELGILDDFLSRPHQKAKELRGWVGTHELVVGDFSHLPVRCPYIAFIPQWDFLDFLQDHAKTYPTFQLLMQAEVNGLLHDKERFIGVKVQTAQGEREIHADLVVGADGRHSIIREKGGLRVMTLGAPIDVLWMKVTRAEADPNMSFGRFDQGQIIAMINRESYWQCAYVIRKGEIDTIRSGGLEAFRNTIVKSLPFLRDRVLELKSWDDIKLLTVRVDRLKEWSRPGLVCIGDAAHAMSPIGGVGINLAVQDAVAAANLLAIPLKGGALSHDDLRRVQDRREWPTQVTQSMQLFVQNNIFRSALSNTGWEKLPLPFRVLRTFPMFARLPGRLIGMGVRPEHVDPEIFR